MRVGGRDVMGLRAKDLSFYRGGEVAMIFQNRCSRSTRSSPSATRSWRRSCPRDDLQRADARAPRAGRCSSALRIPSPQRRPSRPIRTRLSGGMRPSGAMIALALACRPKVLLADEADDRGSTQPCRSRSLLPPARAPARARPSPSSSSPTTSGGVWRSRRIAVCMPAASSRRGATRGVLAHAAPALTIRPDALAGRTGRRQGRAARNHPRPPPDLAAMPEGCAFAPSCSLKCVAEPRPAFAGRLPASFDAHPAARRPLLEAAAARWRTPRGLHTAIRNAGLDAFR